jgi:mRNA interferase MazF
VWDVEFDPQVGTEQAGFRPALVVSGEWFNDLQHGLRIIVPITGTLRGYQHHLEVPAGTAGLNKRSAIMCEQVKAQSLLRFKRPRGHADVDLLEYVQAMIRRFLVR